MKKIKIPYALKIAAIYALIGGGWIVFSDQAINQLFSDPAQVTLAQTYKGLTYAAVTAALLFTLLKKKLSDAELQKKQYRMLLEKLPAVVFVDKINERQTSQFISPQIQNLLGYTAAEWAAAENIWADSLHPEDKARILAEDARTNQTGEAFRAEYRLRHRDGHYVWVEESASIVKDEDGVPIFWQGIIIDITAQKNAAEATQKHLKELIILHAVAQVQSTAENLDDLIKRITDIIGDTLYPESCGILLFDETRGEIKPHFSYRGISPEKINNSLPLTAGVSGKVAATGRSIRLGDVSKEPAYYEFVSGVKSELCVPIINELKTIGVINVESVKENAFTRDDERLLNTIAGGMVNYVKRLNLLELEQKRRETAETIRRATTALTNLLDLPSLHEAILDWLGKIVSYDSASILEQEEDDVRLVAARGCSNPKLEKVFSASNALCLMMQESGEPLIIGDCREDPLFEEWGGADDTRGWMGAPLITRGQVIGYITLDSRAPNAYAQSDAAAVQTFARQAATSLENTRLFSETRRRLSELEIISRASFSLRAARDTDEMFPILIGEIKSSMETDSVGIWLYDSAKNKLQMKAVSGQFADLPKSALKPEEGIIGKVYASGISRVSESFFESPAVAANALVEPYGEFKKDRGVKSTYVYGYVQSIPAEANFFGPDWGSVIVPLRATSETIGALAVALRAPRKLETHHLRLVTTLAEIAGNAIYRSALYERGEEQISQLTLLRELDTAIISSLDLSITLNILVENLLAKMDVAAAAVLVFNPNHQMMEYCAHAGFKRSNLLRTPVKIGDEVISKTLLSHRPFYARDIKSENSERFQTLLADENFASYYAIPLFSKGAVRGILEMYFRTSAPPAKEWLGFVNALAGQATIAIDNAQLFENLQRSNQELFLAYDTTLEGWGKALELRDKDTEGHTRRVADLTVELARQMGIPESDLLHVRRGAILHDIGKMGVPDRILRKAGKLTQKEKAEMRKHPQHAYELLYPINYLRPALDIPYYHHEWWDGSGYPRGLKGEEIPLAARIFTIVDVWDALLSDRPYRAAWSRKKTLQQIRRLAGKQFDPRIVDVFCKMVANMQPARD